MGEIGQVAPMQADGHCGSRSGAQVVPRKGAADFVAPSRTSIKVREHIGRLDDERNSARLPDPAPSMQAPARDPQSTALGLKAGCRCLAFHRGCALWCLLLSALARSIASGNMTYTTYRYIDALKPSKIAPRSKAVRTPVSFASGGPRISPIRITVPAAQIQVPTSRVKPIKGALICSATRRAALAATRTTTRSLSMLNTPPAAKGLELGLLHRIAGVTGEHRRCRL